MPFRKRRGQSTSLSERSAVSRAGVHQVAEIVGGNKRPTPRWRFRAMDRMPTDPIGADEAEAALGNRVECLRVVRRGHRGPWWPPITLATAAVTSTSAASIGTGTWSLPQAKQGRHADIPGRLNRQAGQAVGGLPSIRRPQRDCTMPEAVATAHPALAEPWAVPGELFIWLRSRLHVQVTPWPGPR